MAKNPKVDELILADAVTDAAKAMADRVKSPKISVKRVDVTKNSDLKKLLKGKDLVVSSVSWGLLKQVLSAACETKTNYMDFSLSGKHMEEIREQHHAEDIHPPTDLKRTAEKIPPRLTA